MAARGYGVPVTSVTCKECGANVHVGEGERTTTCAFCGSKEVLASEAGEPPIRPGSLLPFRVSAEDARKRFGGWLASRWFRPNDLKRIASVSEKEMQGVYVPFWTFDADVTARWTAERGHHYYETEAYTDTVNGQQMDRTRQVQRTRWEPASGVRDDRFDDVLVCAGRALPSELVDKLSTFDTKLLVPYQPEFLAGWHAEAYAVDLQPAFDVAQQKISRVQEGRCGSDVGGDTHRGLSVECEYASATFKHVLLPVWVAAYRYRGKVFRFVVNGQTGEVVGVAPWSVWKIVLLVVAILAIIGAIVAVASTQPAAGSSSSSTNPSVGAPAAATAEAPTTLPAQPQPRPLPVPHAPTHAHSPAH